MGQYRTVWTHQCWTAEPSPVDGRIIFDQCPYSWVSYYRRKGWRVYTFQNQKEKENLYILLKTTDHCSKFAEWCKETIKGEKWLTIRLSLDHFMDNEVIIACTIPEVVT